jgi:hypothetical protein
MLKSGTWEDASGASAMTLQQRVIKSGLDSIQNADHECIKSLFENLGAFAEDQIIPVPMLSVLYKSIDPQNKVPTGLKVRTWASVLLSRSILLGSVNAGVSMHDVSKKQVTNTHHYI